VAIYQATDELGVLDRRGSDDDPRRPRLRELLGGVEVADATAGLDLHREAIRDLPDRVEIRGLAGPRAVDVDDVQPLAPSFTSRFAASSGDGATSSTVEKSPRVMRTTLPP
jgi:hypothetical protein